MTATARPAGPTAVSHVIEARLALDRRRRLRSGGGLIIGVAVLAAVQIALSSLGGFPGSLVIPLSDWIDDARRWVIDNQTSHWSFSFFFNPASDFIDWFLRAVEWFLLWLPWFVVAGATAMVAAAVLGLRAGLLAGLGVVYFGAIGLWEECLQTVALMTVAVAIAVAIGVPVGIAAARYDRLQQSLRPMLDAMQTLPAFVYLIPVVLLFGVARVPAIIATVVYALPPVIRLTNLGIRTVPPVTVEAAEMFGATPRQTLRKVQFPQALPSVLTGINQTIMMALSIVVIAALIGAGGLGQVVLVSLRGLFVGRALEAGLAIVVLAVIMDRVTHGAAGIGARRRLRLMPDSLAQFGPVQWVESALAAIDRHLVRTGNLLALPLSRKLNVAAVGRHPRKVLGGVLLVVGALGGAAIGRSEFPGTISFSFAPAIDWLVDWVRDNLYEIGGTWFGTGWFSDSITIHAVTPLRELFSVDLAWPVVVLAVALAGWRLGGAPLAAFCTACVAGLGFLGMWTLSMDTLAQVIVAVAMAILCGVPLGVLAARSDRFERMLKPVLDFLQTIPSFVLLIPVIIMFNVGRIPGIIASVLYALPAATRLTNLGIRQVEGGATEAAKLFGATRGQTLRKVQLPLAAPSIIAGINQAVMLVLAMVVIAGLVGGGGLGLETVKGLRRTDSVGSGFVAGLAIVLLAMLLDRLLQAWTRRFTPVGGGP
ncbi:MAG: ABC transporter permease subunit [Acidimicrobiaceae bacterium]|nr:ABC transporter permease subunit [Acidimicrobiaceae bacterium]MYK74319.1 ABC transporter permease subunit [Acidimicrobiaceae bacterium]